MSATEDKRRESGRELDRIVNFTDGVFAIVITLLILTIQVPEIPPALVAQELPSRLLALGPKVLSYVISFLVVAVYWMAHHRVFRPIRGYDRTLLWLNFVFLMTISFLPFPTSLLGEYGEQLPVVIYAVNVSAASLLLTLISWYATSRGHLTAPDLDEGDTRHGIEGLGEEVASVENEGSQAWMLAEDLPELEAAEPSGMVRLLPSFDHYVVAAPRNREAVLPEVLKRRVYRSQGWLSPVLLVDGRMEGVWRHERKGGRLIVDIEPFAKQPEWVRRPTEEEAEQLSRFLGGELELTWSSSPGRVRSRKPDLTV